MRKITTLAMFLMLIGATPSSAGVISGDTYNNINTPVNTNIQGQLQLQGQDQKQGQAIVGSGNSSVKNSGNSDVKVGQANNQTNKQTNKQKVVINEAKNNAPLPTAVSPNLDIPQIVQLNGDPGALASADEELNMTFSPDHTETYTCEGVQLTIVYDSQMSNYARKNSSDVGCAFAIGAVPLEKQHAFILGGPEKRGNFVSVSKIKAVMKKYLEEKYTGLYIYYNKGMLGKSLGVDASGRGASATPGVGSVVNNFTFGLAGSLLGNASVNHPDAQVFLGAGVASK
ncbi:MAG: hypothetical protein HGA61_01000 [Candidatus Moranbacteria bacterium]|nr:hypothetical protein [Candidatus Moranbacteria bacterium]